MHTVEVSCFSLNFKNTLCFRFYPEMAMPRVVFTPNLQRHLSCPPRAVEGCIVATALQAVFADNPTLRGYVLDDQGRLRQHVAIFVDGRQIGDRVHLTDPVREDSEVFVVQALSGG